MTTGISPYVVPSASDIDTDAAANVVEVELTADEAVVDIGNGVTANAQTFNGAIPGPTFRLNVDDTVIVRLKNNLDHVTGIHWHGIELENSADGTPFTQDQVAAPGGGGPPIPGRATFLYKFKVTRPGLYWYHPHHHSSTNQVFRGLYGMIIISDPHEAALIAAGVLPGTADTIPLVLSDTTVCKAVGMNDAQTYNLTLPWAGPGGVLPVQPGPTPLTLCETAPVDDHGEPLMPVVPFGAGDIPNIQNAGPGRTNEGQTVLTNGMNVGGRAGSPTAPGALAAGAVTHPVLSGQGLRLQIANTASVRYMRLILTTATGVQVDLVRIGGEGGLLDNAVVEGVDVPVPAGTYDPKYQSGEILLPPGTRADVVAAIPLGTTGVLTLWTQDFSRTGAGAGFVNIPTVPVMHLNVTGDAASQFTISHGTALRASIPGASVETLGSATAVLLNPATFIPPKPGMSSQTIQLTNAGGVLGIDGVEGTHDVPGGGPFTSAPHLGSSRYAKVGVEDILQLSVTNATGAHHPFHLHGFSMQPISLTRTGFPTFTWPYREFRDNIDIPDGYTLTFRIRIDDRMLADGATSGGAFGRWMFHCHIFFHAHLGMIGELVAVSPTPDEGKEKPYVNVVGSWAYAPIPGIAERHGTFSSPDGSPVTLSITPPGLGVLASTPPVPSDAGTWSWELDTTGMAPAVQYVYITATDSGGRQEQAVFRLKIGAPDDGSDTGDPHILTVNGKYYDFQAVGEFTLLRDADGFEIQVRQTPVPAANPITDSYSGLTACVSVNTAVAARLGSHRISYQPGQDNRRRLQFFLDGKPAELSARGIDLGGDRVSAYVVANGETAVRVDYANGTVLTITPYFWNSYSIWLLNVNVSRTSADEGIMGSIPRHSWLPALPNGASLGPRPASLHERYVALYQIFANAWRVTDKTSLFVYAPGTSTEMFTDADWPAEKPPCKLKSQFEIPGVPPNLPKITPEMAERICQQVTVDDLHRSCVFDVATTGDRALAKMYLTAQDQRLNGSVIYVVADKNRTQPGEPVIFTATVSAITANRPIPTGCVTFLVNDVAAAPALRLDQRGKANFKTESLGIGEHQIRAVYAPGCKGGCKIFSWFCLILRKLGGVSGWCSCVNTYHASTSPNLLHTVENTQ